MFLKQNRISKKKDFEKIFKKGKGQYGDKLGVKFLKNELKNNRFAVIVSNKVSKKATERNKIKRQIRHILKKQKYKNKTNYDIIIITTPKILNQNYKTIEDSVFFLLKKQELLDD